MTISREMCLEMARQAGFEQYTTPEDTEERFCWPDHIEALVNRAYQEGQKDMRERAASECESRIGSDPDHAWAAQFDNEARDCADAIRSIKL